MLRVVFASVSLVAGLAAGATAVTTGPAVAAPATAAPAAAGSAAPHIMTIIMENTDYSQFAGSPAMPYLNELARHYATFTRAYGWTYPSLPNYLALLSGSDEGTAGRDCDITDKHCGDFTNRTLVDQLEAAGVSWHAYYQGLPSGCYQADGSGNYPYWHNAFRYFREFRAQCGHISNFADLLPDLNKANPADFQWVVPDLVNSGGDNGTMSSGDNWLNRELPQILRSRWYREGGQIVIVYDTGYQDAGGVNGSSGGQIPLVVVSAHVKGMGPVRTPVNTVGVLRSIEHAYGVPYLAAAGDARNGSLGAALVAGRPGAGGGFPVDSFGEQVNISASGRPAAGAAVPGTISVNGVAQIIADPIPNRRFPLIEVGQDAAGHGVVDYAGGPLQVVPGASDLESVSCVNGECFAVGLASPDTDEAVLVTIAGGQVIAVTRLPAFIGLYGVSCTGGLCYAVGYDNADDADAVLTINFGQLSAPAEVAGGGEWLNAISCVSSGPDVCYAAGLVNYLPAVVPIMNGKPGKPVVVPHAWYLNGINCTSVGDCVAVGENSAEQGIVARLVRGKAGPVTVVKGTEYLYGAACQAPDSCLLAGAGVPPADGYSAGVVVPLTNGKPGSVATVPHANGVGQVIAYYGYYVGVGAVYLP